MEPLRLKARQPVVDKVENWDDSDFELDADDTPFRGCGFTNSQNNGPPSRRDSHSSILSLRSDLESMPGEERHVQLPGDDEQSTLEAIAAATKAGIPLPKNVPSSALMGGTIKRLGGRKVKKIIQDDWENDIELLDSTQPLRIKPQDASRFPDILRQVSGETQNSPSKPSSRPSTLPAIIKDDEERRHSVISTTSSVLTRAAHLDKFRDDDDDDLDFFGDGLGTIKVSKTRSTRPISLITPPTPQKDEKPTAPDEDFENDFELPSDGKLKLSMRRNIPKTPSSHADDLDWGEGSLGTRFGGTRRDGRSHRSSSASALSPSVSSSFTAESEDDTFDGLVLPTGPVDFEERLSRQRQSRSPVRSSVGEETPRTDADKDDMLSGLEIGDGEIFDASKLTLHRNIRVNKHRPASPARPKTAVAITFTNKAVQSRLPRPSHERTHSMLEPVSESGGPIPSRSRRPQSRLGHSSQSSVASLPTPTTTSPSHSLLPGTPRKREIGTRSSLTSLRNEPTTTSSQLLRFKRSLPAMRQGQAPAKSSPNGPRHDRPSSRTENNRPSSVLRPKTPVERIRPLSEISASHARKPFLPAGVSNAQSHHVAAKTSRAFRRHDSDNSIDLRSHSRTFSRSALRSPSPRRHRTATQIVQSGVRGEFYRGRPRNFGDGHELDGFDDLPTSAHAEAKYMHQPVKAPLRNKIYQNVLPDRMNTPSPGPYSPPPPSRVDNTPHFARDTTASRIARETSLAQRAPSTGVLAPLTSQRVAQLSSRGNLAPGVPQTTVRSKKHRKPPQLKPHLITNMNKHNLAKHEKGMYYNPQTHRWEGNENVLSAFDPPVASPSTTSLSAHLRERETTTPRPALITNITGTKGVQVVKGMVFDPQNMCWLKLDPQGEARPDPNDPMDSTNGLDDEDDVFKDIPDLEDLSTADTNDGVQGRMSDVRDDWLVGEEFDVGPEFVRRQHEEEDRWRKKCEKWVGVVERDREAWRWTIRDLLVFQRAAQ
ncbi:hypothetical protein ACRALDRAFT_1025584 [Sodiomyces alcalophilus JCM 7366]|uniref:uncharacterized protein n=1 Tax=Sodiomyces alcalophilus JCM 7366 TaxID=591952 RepID=UPI0039B56ED8